MANPNPDKSFSNIYCIFFNMTLLGGNLWRLIIKSQFKKLFNSVANSDGGLQILQNSGSGGPKNLNPQLKIRILMESFMEKHQTFKIPKFLFVFTLAYCMFKKSWAILVKVWFWSIQVNLANIRNNTSCFLSKTHTHTYTLYNIQYTI